MFEVGERVVCVDDDWSNLTAYERGFDETATRAASGGCGYAGCA